MKESLRDRLVREEGIQLFPYKDSRGIWTIGVGHNIEMDAVMSQNLEWLRLHGITKEDAYALLDRDIRDHSRDLLEALPWVSGIDDIRRSVLIDMTFNMGIDKLLGFRDTLMAIEDERWQDAHDEMLDSKWAGQVGGRAKQLARIMLTGDDNEIRRDV